MFSFGNSRPIVTCGPRVTRAPLHHTLSVFLNLHGIKGEFYIWKVLLKFI